MVESQPQLMFLLKSINLSLSVIDQSMLLVLSGFFYLFFQYIKLDSGSLYTLKSFQAFLAPLSCLFLKSFLPVQSFPVVISSFHLKVLENKIKIIIQELFSFLLMYVHILLDSWLPERTGLSGWYASRSRFSGPSPPPHPSTYTTYH